MDQGNRREWKEKVEKKEEEIKKKKRKEDDITPHHISDTSY